MVEQGVDIHLLLPARTAHPRSQIGHRMVTNYAETVSLCVRPDMDTPYRAHVEGIFVTGRCEEALTQATSNPWAAGSIPARRAISNP